MLHFITDLTHKLLNFIKDDPVRPEIALEERINKHSQVYVLHDAELVPQAVVCVKYQSTIPRSVEELAQRTEAFTTAVFYTIWSYKAGAGQELIRQAKLYIETNIPSITTFVTLSPPTEMARRFHLKNGATIHQTNELTVNYLYV